MLPGTGYRQTQVGFQGGSQAPVRIAYVSPEPNLIKILEGENRAFEVLLGDEALLIANKPGHSPVIIRHLGKAGRLWTLIPLDDDEQQALLAQEEQQLNRQRERTNQ